MRLVFCAAVFKGEETTAKKYEQFVNAENTKKIVIQALENIPEELRGSSEKGEKASASSSGNIETAQQRQPAAATARNDENAEASASSSVRSPTEDPE